MLSAGIGTVRGRGTVKTAAPLLRAPRGSTLEFEIGTCALGQLLVATTPQGIAAILLGDNADALVRDLERRFEVATRVVGNAAFEDTVAKVVGLVERPGTGLDLPLDIRGTPFQRRVWEALRAIPPGTTATYREIAETIGMPKAVRAVAAACAANHIAVAIPCHRVVRTDGGLAGYRWGIDRKRELLAREAAANERDRRPGDVTPAPVSRTAKTG